MPRPSLQRREDPPSRFGLKTLRTVFVFETPQSIRCRIRPARLERLRQRTGLSKDMAQHPYGVGDVQSAIVVRVSGAEAGRYRPESEEMTEDKDGIRDVETAVPVGVPPEEEGTCIDVFDEPRTLLGSVAYPKLPTVKTVAG